MKKYYSLVNENNEATIHIYGDITSWEFLESDVSSYTLSKELDALDVGTINVCINSYGGEVAEGLAIFNALKRHKAKIKTFCDGFACSIASVVFMAGDERIMANASLLFVHNAWNIAVGNSTQMKKAADDLEIVNQASVNAYMEAVNVEAPKLKEMLDAETWILPQDALNMGFATMVINDSSSKNASQSIKKSIIETIMKQQAVVPPVEKPEPIVEPILDPEPIPEPIPEPNPDPEPQENKTLKFINALTR